MIHSYQNSLTHNNYTHAKGVPLLGTPFVYIDFDIENTLYIKCRVFMKSDYLMCLEPRSVIATPSLQRGQSSCVYVGTSRLSKACTFS